MLEDLLEQEKRELQRQHMQQHQQLATVASNNNNNNSSSSSSSSSTRSQSHPTLPILFSNHFRLDDYHMIDRSKFMMMLMLLI